MHKFYGLVAVALVLGLCASPASAGSLITFSVEGSTSATGPFSDSLTVKANTTYYYEVIATMAPVATMDGTHTITSLVPAVDGINSFSLDLKDMGTTPVPISISAGTLMNGFGNGPGPSGGTPSGNNLDGARGIQLPGVFVGVSATNTPAPVVVMTGTFTTGSSVTGTSSLLDGSFGDITSGIKINDGGAVVISSNSETGANPIVGYQGLMLMPQGTSVPEPTSIALLGLGLGGVVLTTAMRRRKRVVSA